MSQKIRLAIAVFVLTVAFTSSAYSQTFTVTGYSPERNELIVRASDGRDIPVPLSTYNTKARIMAYLNSFDVPEPQTIPPAIQNLIGKRFDKNGNELP